jgi:hypothetical protein
MKYKSLYFIVLGGIFLLSLVAYSYNNTTTHAALTEEAASFFSLSFPGEQIASEYSEALIEGAILEDAEPRYINHFYDPTTGKGWLMDNAGDQPFLFRLATKLGVSTIAPISAKDWATNERAQEQYANYEGNRTYQRAIREYARGDKKEAFKTLGFVLHLVQDMTVPDHTRQDTHTGIFGDEKSPYEVYADQYQRGGIKVVANYIRQRERATEFQSLGEYFDYLAKYSNKYYFSNDTVEKNYNSPQISRWEKLDNKYSIGFTYDQNRTEMPLVVRDDSTGALSINNSRILSSYWERLSKKAILGSAGVIQLFLKEAQEAERNYNPTTFQRMTTGISEATTYLYYSAAGPQFSPWGTINKLVNVERTYSEMRFAAEMMGGFINNAVGNIGSLFSRLTGSLSGAAPVVTNSDGLSEEDVRYDPPVPSFPISPDAEPVISKPSDRGEIIVDGGEASGIVAAPQQPIAQDPISIPQLTSLTDTFSVITNPITLPAGMGFSGGFIPTFGASSGQELEAEAAQDPAPIEQNETSDNGDLPQDITEEDPPVVPPEEEAIPEPPQDTTAPMPTLRIMGYRFGVREIMVEYGVGGETPDFSSHEIQFRVGNNEAWADINQAIPTVDMATVSASFIFQAEDYSTMSFRIRSKDTLQNTSEWVAVTALQDAAPVIINEIAWMGSPESQYDEWFELYNKTNLPIDLAEGWRVQSRHLNIDFSQQEKNNASAPNTILAPYGYYLVERKTESKELPSLSNADWFGSFGEGLVNIGAPFADYLRLMSPSGEIIGSVNQWYAGSNGPKKTMERISEYSGTNVWQNWTNCQEAEGYGTPRAENSVHGLFIAKTGVMVSDETWDNTESPYAVFDELRVNAGATLTIKAGVVVKLTGAQSYPWMPNSLLKSKLNVLGALRIDGARDNKVIFTSFEDDADGRDTNQDANATSPLIASYSGISINSPTKKSSLNGLDMRYAGSYVNPKRPMIDVLGGEVEIYDSSFSHPANGIIGVQRGSLTVERSEFAVVSEDGVGTNGELYGVKLSTDAALSVSNNTFSGLYEGVSSNTSLCGSLSGNVFKNNTYPIRISGAIPLLSENQFADNIFNATQLVGSISSTCGEYTAHNTFSVEGQLRVTSLSVGPGSVFKFGPDTSSTMLVLGGISVHGAADEPAVFTSINDTEYGGATYALSAQGAAAGDWMGVRISGGESTIDHALFRYGGRVYFGRGHYESSILEVSNATASVSASTIEYSMYIGMRALNANTTLDNITVQNNNYVTNYSYGFGLIAENSMASIARSTFRNNGLGIQMIGGAITVDDKTKANSTDTSEPVGLLSH